MTSLVEEAVSVGDLVRIFTFHQSGASMYEITLRRGDGGRAAGLAIDWPSHSVLAAIIRGDRPIPPSPTTRSKAATSC